MGGAAQQGLNLRQAEIGVDQLSDNLCYRLGSDLGPLDLLSEGREFLLELLRLSLPFGIQIEVAMVRYDLVQKRQFISPRNRHR